MPDDASKSLSAHAAAPRGLAWRLVKALLIGIGLACLVETLNVLAGPNVHEVVPGAVYRAAQSSGPELRQLIQHFGIRTVVNLRGVSDPFPWYLEESRVTEEADVCQEDLSFSAGRLPAVVAVRHLVEVIDRAEYPLLFHCNRGIDRTGMATAMTLLLHTDASLDRALAQLGWRHGHFPFGKTGQIDRFFTLYHDWLRARGESHSREAFRRFAEKEYCPGECRAALVLLEPEKLKNIGLEKQTGIRVRATNTSIDVWHLQPGANAGTNCSIELRCRETGYFWEGQAGLFYRTVQPGESIDLTVCIPAVPEPGRYRLRLAMNDPQHGLFPFVDGEPLIYWVEVK